MAQKAAKSTARRNADVLNRTHLIALAIHALFLITRVLLFRSSFTRSSLLLYAILSSPALVVEFFFERSSRPRYRDGELRSSGEDLESKGLTEWMWDVLYWTWGCTVSAALFGDRAWWLYVVVPAYSAWLAYATFTGIRQGLGGAMSADGQAQGEATGKGLSKRQQKTEKRGSSKMQHR